MVHNEKRIWRIFLFQPSPKKVHSPRQLLETECVETTEHDSELTLILEHKMPLWSPGRRGGLYTSCEGQNQACLTAHLFESLNLPHRYFPGPRTPGWNRYTQPLPHPITTSGFRESFLPYHLPRPLLHSRAQRAATAGAFREEAVLSSPTQGLQEDSPLEQEFQRTFSVHGQKVNILEFAGHMAKSRI